MISLPSLDSFELRYRRARLDTAETARYDAVLVCLLDKPSASLATLPYASIWRRLQALSSRSGARSTLQTRLPNDAATSMAIGFLKEDASPFACLSLAGKLAKECKIDGAKRVAIAVLGFGVEQTRTVQEALVSAVLAASAPLPEFKSLPSTAPALQTITVLHGATKPDFSASLATHAGNHLARWLTVLPPNQLDCVAYARILRTLARQHGWGYAFLNEAKLQRAGAGAFLAVSRANSHRGAGIVQLRYRSGRKGARRIALVGKGICFDTGGINLKSHKSMYLMHEDMMGSAVAIGTLLALTRLRAPVDVDCWLALTENEIGARAYRPQEVVTATNGVTIQVAHSDAEGRMVLADTLALASREKPEVMIDFATLTGACVVALTERMSGVFTNRDEWRATLERAGQVSGERVWSFPMDEDFDTDLDSRIADILQCTPDSKGDHILAARFLSRFVDRDIGWVHVDLAASNRTGGLAHIPTDVTGFGVRFAVEWLLNHRDARHETRDKSE